MSFPTKLYQFKLRRRVLRYRHGYRWIITDGTQAVHAHGQEAKYKLARASAGVKLIELKAKAKAKI